MAWKLVCSDYYTKNTNTKQWMKLYISPYGNSLDVEVWGQNDSDERLLCSNLHNKIDSNIFKVEIEKNGSMQYENTFNTDMSSVYEKKSIVWVETGDEISLKIYEEYTPQPPSTPLSISIPESINRGYGYHISWGNGSRATSYRLERKINNGSWQQIYSGSLREYIDTAQDNWETIQYRVRAHNEDGYSSYRTSDVIVVISMPRLKFKMNNELKTAEKGWVKIDGQLIEIEKIWAKVNGALKEVE